MSDRTPSPPTIAGPLPWAVLAVGVLAALIHTVPMITAAMTVPEGWRATGIHQSSPDLMQYRQWFRQTQLEGPVISNMLTAEPHQPYMLVIFAWAIGTIASWLGAAPEFVYQYAGCVFALLLVIVIYRLVEAFVADRTQRWWIFGAILLGGGLGGYHKVLMRFEALRNLPGVRRFVWEPFMEWNIFEDYRGQFVFTTLFDSHFLLAWLCTSASVLLLHRYIARPSAMRLGTATALAFFTGAVHLHSGLSVVIIGAGIAWMCWVGKQHVREALTAAVVVSAGAIAGVGLQALLIGPGGLPTPPWEAHPILPFNLFLAYTLQWILATWALTRLWPKPTLGTCVLTGWVVGCLIYTFSAPIWPYPDRGTMTLLIPITLLGGLGYFSVSPRPSPRAIAVGAALLLVTPIWAFAFNIQTSRFAPELNAKFVSADHDAIVAAAKQAAGRRDLLLADEQSLLWLAPEYPGTNYCAHFFMTVDYARKQREVTRFYAAPAEEQAAFLREHEVRFLFVPTKLQPARFKDLPGLTVVAENRVGALYARPR